MAKNEISIDISEDIDTPNTDETNSFEESNELVQQSVNSTTIELTTEEKLAIADNKKKRGGKSNELTLDKMEEISLDDALSEYKDLYNFVEDKVKMEAGSGKIETIPCGVDLLDTVLGGGVGVGTMTVIAGNPGTFKSAIAGQIIGNAQKKFKGNTLAQYLDSESTMTMKRLYQMGVQYPPLKPIDKNVTVENVFKTIESIIAFKQLKGKQEVPGVVVWDSLANTSTEVEMNQPDLDINKTIGLRARILSFVLPRYVGRLRENNMSLIVINQLRDKIDMGRSQSDLRWMGTKNMPGGQSIKYNAFHLILLKTSGDLDESKYGFAGVKVNAKCVKNKLFTPNIPVDLIVNFKTGVDDLYTKAEFLVDNKILKTAAWCKLPGYEGSFRYRDIQEKYDSEEEFKNIFDELYEKAKQEFIIDKYSDNLDFLNDEETE